MNKRTLSLVLILIVIQLVFSGFSLAEEKKKSNWYIGFGIGTGELKVDGETMDDFFDDSPSIRDLGQELTLHFGVGKIVNPKLHVGFDASTIRQSAEDDFNHHADIQITNYYTTISYYPMEKGLFLKTGAGISRTNVVVGNIGVYEQENYTGTGFLFGFGYDFWLGKSFNLGIHAEYSKQSYIHSNAPDDTEFTTVYLSFYWF